LSEFPDIRAKNKSTRVTDTSRLGNDAALAQRHTGARRSDLVARYYSLTKPGVLYANVLTAVAGFLFGSQSSVNVPLLLAVTAGTTLIVASATVLNNVLDRDIDHLMARTRTRATVSGSIPVRHAILYSVALGVAGTVILLLYATPLVVGIGLTGFVVYVWLYGALSKRRSYRGTLVGSISGAAPILAGYTAATGRIDIAAALLFTALFLWQMPEFYSIAIYRKEEYEAAGVPVITVVKGVRATIWQILVYTVLYATSVLLLGVFGYTGLITTTVLAVVNTAWIILALAGLRTTTVPAVWAKTMFRFSLLAILGLCVMVSIDALLL